MSRASIYVFVEGSTDRHVFGGIVEQVGNNSQIQHEITTSEQLSGDSGGKTVLLDFYDYLRIHSSLVDKFEGKTTLSIFYLDKDIDDFLRKRRRSKHVIYTESYELENYLYMYGKIAQAAASAAGLDIQSVQRGIGDYSQWRNRVALIWKDWTKLCFFSHCTECGLPYYGRPTSQINTAVCGPLDKALFKKHLSGIRKQLKLSSATFRGEFSRWAKKVDKMYFKGTHDRVFKGKWYSYFLIEDIKRIAGGSKYNSQGLPQSLHGCLALTLDFQAAWAGHFRLPLLKLVSENL